VVRRDIVREPALRNPEAGIHCLRRSHDVERFYVIYGRKVAEDKDSQETQVLSRLDIKMERIAVRRVCGERVVHIVHTSSTNTTTQSSLERN